MHVAMGASPSAGALAAAPAESRNRLALLSTPSSLAQPSGQFGSDWTFGRPRSYGGTPWDNMENVIRWSPAHNMENYVTPTLVIHGERDYRVPVGNGLEIYGMLKRKGVPARLIYFPDENHWVLKPQNSIQWHDEVMGWLTKWIAE